MPDSNATPHFHCGDAVVDWRFPSWNETTLADAWEYQAYVAGSLFALIALVAAIFLFQRKSAAAPTRSTSNLRNDVAASARRFAYSLQILLIFLGTTRVVVLCADPYKKFNRLPPLLYHLLFSSTDPALLTALSLLGIVLTQQVIASRRLVWWFRGCLSGKVIICLAFVHFFINTTAEILFHYKVARKSVYIVCNLFTSVWGMFLCFFFPAMGVRTFMLLDRARQLGAASKAKCRQWTDSYRLLILVCLTAFSGLCYCTLHTVTLVQTLRCVAPGDRLLFGLSTVTRIAEFVMAALLLAATIRTRGYGRYFICCKRRRRSQSTASVLSWGGRAAARVTAGVVGSNMQLEARRLSNQSQSMTPPETDVTTVASDVGLQEIKETKETVVVLNCLPEQNGHVKNLPATSVDTKVRVESDILFV